MLCRSMGLLMMALLPAVLGASEEMPPSETTKNPALSRAGGPTIRLDYEREKSAGNPIASFMYFVPLISPDPVSVVTSPGNTQTARVISAQRRITPNAFSTKCDFEIVGEGSQQNIFDLTHQIRQHERKLKEGGVLQRQLGSITVEGPGSGCVEVQGTVSNGARTVTEVRLRFNARGKTSPVSIGLCDIRHQDNAFQRCNEIVARVNTLIFTRKHGQPKMEVTVTGVKKKGAGDNLWQNIQGGLKGVVSNLLIDPLTVEAKGYQAMLDFGHALTTSRETFTFPLSWNLQHKGRRHPAPIHNGS